MSTPADARRDLEGVLGHPVDVVLPPSGSETAFVAVSRAGDPPRVRAAWVTPDGVVVARLGVPPGVPSAVRPLVAALADVTADGVSGHVLLGRAAPGVSAARALLAGAEPVEFPVAHGGVIAGHVPRSPMLVALDALTRDGEPIGRLMHTGIHELTLVAGRVSGRLGASHGMAAGFGAGATVAGLPFAESEAGYGALLPEWLPAGFAMATVRVEPEAAYPFAPPSIAIAWAAAAGAGAPGGRVLLRQAPGPLAVPESPDGRGRAEIIHGRVGVMRGRGQAFLVWEAGNRAFGLQVRGVDSPEDVALHVARSIPVAAA